MSLPDAAREFLIHLEDRVRGLGARKRIVFPEGKDPRIIQAAEELSRKGLVEPILVTDPSHDPRIEKYAKLYQERRKRSGISERDARDTARRPLYFAALMVAADDADGTVGGAANSTAETVRAALQCVGTAKGIRTISSFFVLAVPDRSLGCHGLYVAADCAVVVEPTPSQLADITISATQTARTFLECESLVLLLPANDPAHTEEAQRALNSRAPALQVTTDIDRMAGANTLIFPSLNSANIGYKLVEWLGGAAAFGPMLQGLAKPANDLSRAATVHDVYSVALFTALQAGETQP